MAPVEAVISGIGGAFPQSEGLENFIDNLLEGKNLSSVDDLRWKPGLLGTSPHVGKIGNVHRFDNNLFKVHMPLARLMDPLARLMLERSMEAVLDAGLAPEDLSNTYTSVYMTTTVSESESRTTSLLHSKKAAGYAIMAGSKTMMSNRISYCLNLNGPSVTLDGDWTVGLVAMQRAARSIEIGESDFALIGAANTCLFPELNKIYENLGVLSTDGQCLSLDASASGCFRAEGAVVFLLQRADAANRIYARLGGIHEVCMGTRSRFLGVDALALAPLMRSLYSSTAVDPTNVAMLTSDGISIPEIERDEMEASAAVLCQRRSSLPVSSAKGVAGHGDAVGALISVIHGITAMERGLIPPLTHYKQPHPENKALRDGRMQVVTSPQHVQMDENSVVAVNTLGYSGCIAHAIFRPNTKVKQPTTQENCEYPRLIVVAGRTEEDVVRVTNQIVDKPFDPEFIRLTQQAFSKPIIGYTHRATTIVPAEESWMRPIISSKACDSKPRPVWFVYSGMGSQWAGMGKGLLRIPEFAETIQRLQPVLEPDGIDLMQTITTDDTSLFENIIYAFISIAAIQIGLTNLMRSLGVHPDGIIGHSTGELGCAYGDGCLTEEETLRAAYARGRASLAVELPKGMMASIGMPWKEALEQVPATVDVACHNSEDNCTISGPTTDVQQFVDEITEKNVFARTVNVSNIAFHSRYVMPAGDFLHDFLKKVIVKPKKRSERWVASSINPGDENKQCLGYAGPEFFTNNLLSPVRFEEAMRSVPAGAVVIELAPHGLMQPLIRRGLPEGAFTVGLTRRGHKDGLRFLLEGVGKLYMEGVPVKPWLLAPPVSLPVSRSTPCLNSLASWDHREEWPLVINTRSQVTRPKSVPLYLEITPCILQGGKRFASPSSFVEIVWKEIADGKPLTSCPVMFSNLEFRNVVELQALGNIELILQLQRETGLFEMIVDNESEEWGSSICVMRGQVTIPDPTDLVGMVSAHPADRDGVVRDHAEVYAELHDNDLTYDEELRSLEWVRFSETETTGLCNWSGKWHRLLDSLFQLAILTNPHGSVVCGKVRKVTIAPQEIKALSSGLPVRHVLGTSILAGPGINIEGYQRAESKVSTPLATIGMSIGQLQQHDCKEVPAFLKSVALMRVQNSDTLKDFSVLVLESDRDGIATQLQEAIRNVVGHQVMVRKIPVHRDQPMPTEVRGTVVVVTDFRSNQVQRVLAHLEKAYTGPLPQHQPMILRCGVRGGLDGFRHVTSSINAEESLSLLIAPRPLTEASTRVLQVRADENVPSDLEIPVDGEVILVWRGLPREGVFGAVAAVRGKQYGAKARIVIVIDGDAPEFSLEKDTFRERLALGLLVNILQNGRWSDLLLSNFHDLPVVPAKTEGVKVTHFGLNPSDLGYRSTPRLGAYDYCGTLAGTSPPGPGGVRVMGLAGLTLQGKGSVSPAPAPAAVPDDTLRWDVPASWSDQEAATVPMAYAVAYHVLEVLVQLRPSMHVLVVNGVTPVSQACIRVAAAAGCRVITTVGSERERGEVLALNPQVSPECVFRHDKNTLEYHLMRATNGNGLDVSLVPSTSLADTISRCIAMNGSVFVMSKTDALAHSFGMLVFLRSSNLFGAGPDALLTATNRDKLAVQAAVQAGIASGVVQPLSARVVGRAEDLDEATLQSPVKQLLRVRDADGGGTQRTSSTGNGNGNGNGNRVPGVAFAIAGGRTDSLVSMARAASAKGSSVVLAANRDCQQGATCTPARARFVPALRQTTFVPFPKSQTQAKEFLQLASKANKLKAIVVNVEDAADHALTSLLQAVLPSANGALKGVRLLVLTESLALGTEAVESWRRMGLAACAVVGDPRLAGRILPTLLTVADLPAAVLAYQRGTDCRVALGAPAFRSQRDDPSAVRRPGLGGRTFVEVPSLAARLRFRHNRLEPLPLFAVTGPELSPSLARESAESVMSPVLVADGSLVTADELVQEMLRLQPRGPWALVGDTTSAPLLLRAANEVVKRAGRPHWREVVHLALLEEGTLTDEGWVSGLTYDGPLHLIRQYEGVAAKTVNLNENKVRHFVMDIKQIATVLNDHLLSPLSKIISC